MRAIRKGSRWVCIQPDRCGAWNRCDVAIIQPCIYERGSPPARELVAFKLEGQDEVFEVSLRTFATHFVHLGHAIYRNFSWLTSRKEQA